MSNRYTAAANSQIRMRWPTVLWASQTFWWRDSL